MTASAAPVSYPRLTRLIPCLLLNGRLLYKTVRFRQPTYIGDPINAVRIFSDKEADEITVIDITATSEEREPDFPYLVDLAAQAFMPLCYGGGINTIGQMERLFSSGIEKVMLSSAALQNPGLVAEAASRFGSQSVVVCLDVKRTWWSKQVAVYSQRGTKRHPGSPTDWAHRFQEEGAGELVVNNIERDGTMEGYDHEMIKAITSRLAIPVIALGGAASVDDMEKAISQSGAGGAAAGSLFSFRWPERAVLINYPKFRHS